jgi:hypothetical protein
VARDQRRRRNAEVADLPSSSVLRKRVQLLIERFVG